MQHHNVYAGVGGKSFVVLCFRKNPTPAEVKAVFQRSFPGERVEDLQRERVPLCLICTQEDAKKHNLPPGHYKLDFYNRAPDVVSNARTCATFPRGGSIALFLAHGRREFPGLRPTRVKASLVKQKKCLTCALAAQKNQMQVLMNKFS